MKRLFAILNTVVFKINILKQQLFTQDFTLPSKGYEFDGTIIPFILDIWIKDGKRIIRYKGKEWKRQREQFSLEFHKMSWKEWMKPVNDELRVAKDFKYNFDTV